MTKKLEIELTNFTDDELRDELIRRTEEKIRKAREEQEQRLHFICKNINAFCEAIGHEYRDCKELIGEEAEATEQNYGRCKRCTLNRMQKNVGSHGAAYVVSDTREDGIDFTIEMRRNKN